jgi:hypothetical protein
MGTRRDTQIEAAIAIILDRRRKEKLLQERIRSEVADISRLLECGIASDRTRNLPKNVRSILNGFAEYSRLIKMSQDQLSRLHAALDDSQRETDNLWLSLYDKGKPKLRLIKSA